MPDGPRSPGTTSRSRSGCRRHRRARAAARVPGAVRHRAAADGRRPVDRDRFVARRRVHAVQRRVRGRVRPGGTPRGPGRGPRTGARSSARPLAEAQVRLDELAADQRRRHVSMGCSARAGAGARGPGLTSVRTRRCGSASRRAAEPSLRRCDWARATRPVRGSRGRGARLGASGAARRARAAGRRTRSTVDDVVTHRPGRRRVAW